MESVHPGIAYVHVLVCEEHVLQKLSADGSMQPAVFSRRTAGAASRADLDDDDDEDDEPTTHVPAQTHGMLNEANWS